MDCDDEHEDRNHPQGNTVVTDSGRVWSLDGRIRQGAASKMVWKSGEMIEGDGE
jgi:hypothetical protein